MCDAPPRSRKKLKSFQIHRPPLPPLLLLLLLLLPLLPFRLLWEEVPRKVSVLSLAQQRQGVQPWERMGNRFGRERRKMTGCVLRVTTGTGLVVPTATGARRPNLCSRVVEVAAREEKAAARDVPPAAKVQMEAFQCRVAARVACTTLSEPAAFHLRHHRLRSPFSPLLALDPPVSAHQASATLALHLQSSPPLASGHLE